MSAFCRPEQPGLKAARGACGQRGFTLLELLVVLAMMGLLIGLVTPRLSRLGLSVESATQRKTVELEINGLGHRVWALGEAVSLDAGVAGRLMRDGHPVLDLPEGWRLLKQTPIRYGINGYCEGGRLLVQAPDGSVDGFDLRPPRCQVEATQFLSPPKTAAAP